MSRVVPGLAPMSRGVCEYVFWVSQVRVVGLDTSQKPATVYTE